MTEDTSKQVEVFWHEKDAVGQLEQFDHDGDGVPTLHIVIQPLDGTAPHRVIADSDAGRRLVKHYPELEELGAHDQGAETPKAVEWAGR